MDQKRRNNQNATKINLDDLARAYQEYAREWQNDPDKDFWNIEATDNCLDNGEVYP
jgi:hypothetical protein